MSVHIRNINPNPCLEISKKSRNNKWEIITRTNIQRNTTFPVWNELNIPITGNLNEFLLIKCNHIQDTMNNNINNNSYQLCQCIMTMQDILNQKQKILFNPNENNKKCGILLCRSKYNENNFDNNSTVLSYLMGGMHLHLNIAIDCTGNLFLSLFFI